MRRRLSLLSLLFAWLLATGSHWDLVQTFAWGRMIASYARTMPLAEAVRLTFTPDNLCGVCEVVSEAKQQQPANTPGTAPGGGLSAKVFLVFQPASQVIAPVPMTLAGVTSEMGTWQGVARAAPPVPPPRVRV